MEIRVRRRNTGLKIEKKVQKNCQRLKSTFYVIFSKFLTVCRIALFEIFFKCWIIMPIWGKYCTRKNPKNWTLLWILGHCGRARVAMVACFLCNTQKLACCWNMSQWNIYRTPLNKNRRQQYFILFFLCENIFFFFLK